MPIVDVCPPAHNLSRRAEVLHSCQRAQAGVGAVPESDIVLHHQTPDRVRQILGLLNDKLLLLLANSTSKRL